jgi:hypothetical protein
MANLVVAEPDNLKAAARTIVIGKFTQAAKTLKRSGERW